MKNIQLNNGVQMPLLGYGVYQVDPEECERCVSDAISVGFSGGYEPNSGSRHQANALLFSPRPCFCRDDTTIW